MFKMIFNIARVELEMLFYSPVAWLILVIFGVQAGLIFEGRIQSIVSYQEMGYVLSGCTSAIFSGRSGVFSVMQSYLYFYIPLLTMSLVSRELSSGSIRLLYSSPITNLEIIIGKFFSMMIYAAIMLTILLLMVVYSNIVIKDFNLAAALTGLLGLYLLICAYSAIGLFMSSLTSYQIVAAIGTFAILMFLNMVGGWWQQYDFVRDVTYWLSIKGRSSTFISGLICSEDLLYFILVVCLFLGLAIIRLEAVRQKIRFVITLGRNIFAIVLICVLGALTTLPYTKCYYDATTTKRNTLTPNSQEIVKKLDGKLTITTYINALDPQIMTYGKYEFLKPDMDRFNQYLRFKPDMKLNYVYYYDSTENQIADRLCPNGTLLEKMKTFCSSFNVDTNLFLAMPPEKIRQRIDLTGEGNRFVREIVRGNGEKAWLRNYNDIMRYPGEAEISASFKRMVMTLPKVGFLTGHGERSYQDNKDRDYSAFAYDKSFRYALMNQGFDIESVTLDKEIPAEINILIIPEMRNPLSPEEDAVLQKYIDRGSNLFILGEPRRREIMNILLDKFGFELMPGVLVKDDVERQADFILSFPTKEAESIAYEFGNVYNKNNVITTPSCSGLRQIDDKGYTVTELFRSDTVGSWNELETIDFVDDSIRLNPAIGEVEKSYPTVVALSKKIGDKEQRILISGDADCISNGEFGRQLRSTKHAAMNYSLVSGGFFWLSDNEVPIDIRRPASPDDKLYLGPTGSKITKWSFVLVLPLLLAAWGILLWVRRKGR